MNFLTIFFGTFIIGSFKAYGETKLSDENYLSFIGAISSIIGCFRFIWSFLIDHYSYKLVYGILIFIQIILAFTFPFIVQYKHVYMVWVSLSFLTEGGHFTLVPAILKKLFGEEGSRIFGWAFSFIGIASLIKIFKTIKKYIINYKAS